MSHPVICSCFYPYVLIFISFSELLSIELQHEGPAKYDLMPSVGFQPLLCALFGSNTNVCSYFYELSKSVTCFVTLCIFC